VYRRCHATTSSVKQWYVCVMCVCDDVCVFVCDDVCVYVCIFHFIPYVNNKTKNIHTHTSHTHTHTHTYIHTHTHTHTQVIASILESASTPGEINVSEVTSLLLGPKWWLEKSGRMTMPHSTTIIRHYFLKGRHIPHH